jgi:hypothetical protein
VLERLLVNKKTTEGRGADASCECAAVFTASCIGRTPATKGDGSIRGAGIFSFVDGGSALLQFLSRQLKRMVRPSCESPSCWSSCFVDRHGRCRRRREASVYHGVEEAMELLRIVAAVFPDKVKSVGRGETVQSSSPSTRRGHASTVKRSVATRWAGSDGTNPPRQTGPPRHLLMQNTKVAGPKRLRDGRSTIH